MIPKLALIVGHSKDKPGTRGVVPGTPNEYEFNSELAMDLYSEAKARGLDCRIFKRDGLTIKEVGENVNLWAMPDGVAIELHCNAFNGHASGTETLFDLEPASNRFFAEIIQRKMIGVFGTKQRSNRGIKLRSTKDLDLSNDRGAINLESVKVTSCLVEPVFWDRRDECELLLMRYREYVKALISGVCDWYLKEGDKKNGKSI